MAKQDLSIDRRLLRMRLAEFRVMQKAFAHEAHVSAVSLSLFLNERYDPGEKFLYKLALAATKRGWTDVVVETVPEVVTVAS